MAWELTQELADDLCTHLSQGKSLRSWCEHIGRPSAATICRWLAEGRNAWFAEQYTRAREAQADAIFDEILDIADETKGGANEDVQSARVRIDARKWMAGKLRPKVYGEKVDLTHSGGDSALKLEVTWQSKE